VFDIGEEYEFEIIRDDDGDGSLTLSVRKIQVRFRATFSPRRDRKSAPNYPRPSNHAPSSFPSPETPPPSPTPPSALFVAWILNPGLEY
jgi:hypothetical protein